MKEHLKNIDLKIHSLIVTLNCLEHNWFEIVIPAIEELDNDDSLIVKSLADEEFNNSYSNERAEKDPNYDALRVIEKENYFYAAQSSLLWASQQTVNALYVALGVFIDQCLIEIINDSKLYFGRNKIPSKFQGFDIIEKSLTELEIDFDKSDFHNIKKIRDLANYLKHGKGPAAENIKDIIKQLSQTTHDSPLLHFRLPTEYLKEDIGNLRQFLKNMATKNNQYVNPLVTIKSI